MTQVNIAEGKKEVPQWLQEEAERLYEIETDIMPSQFNDIQKAKRTAHINAVLGCLEKYADKTWDECKDAIVSFTVGETPTDWQRVELPSPPSQ